LRAAKLGEQVATGVANSGDLGTKLAPLAPSRRAPSRIAAPGAIG
jgi:hypothetical protein